MAAIQQITVEEYQRIVASNDDRQWELVEGQLREKPGNTWEHGAIKSELAYLLMRQLNRAQYHVFSAARVRQFPATILIPDLMVVPDSYGEGFRGRPDVLAIFPDPLPLVVEIWTEIDGYDVDAKVPIYRQRGDREIWRIHPYEKTVITWRRQPNETYDEAIYHDGILAPMALTGVSIGLADLFTG